MDKIVLRCAAPPEVTAEDWEDVPDVHKRLITEKLGNMGCDGTFKPGRYCGSCIYAQAGRTTQDLTIDYEDSPWRTHENVLKDDVGKTALQERSPC